MKLISRIETTPRWYPPVAANAVDCVGLSLWAGLCRSPIPANTKHHLKAGAQKKTVFGPAGLSHNGLTFGGTNLSSFAIDLQYTEDIVTAIYKSNHPAKTMEKF